jgi:hypothetical protein
MTTPLLTALALGFFGSLHCVGMCGPIVLALPGKSSVFSRFMGLRLVYNAGRIITYAWLGLMLGLFGRQIQLSGWQAQLSIASGLLILLFTLLPHLSARFKTAFQPGRFVSQFLGDFLYKPNYGGQFVTGLLNGLLPCGLVYLALAGALLVGDPVVSAGFMVVFGLGTLPALLTVAILGRQLLGKFRPLFSKISPVIAILMAALFILRGLSLGIPYLSPQLTHPAQAQTEVCH